MKVFRLCNIIFYVFCLFKSTISLNMILNKCIRYHSYNIFTKLRSKTHLKQSIESNNVYIYEPLEQLISSIQVHKSKTFPKDMILKNKYIGNQMNIIIYND